MADALGKLLEIKWKGTSFPVSDLSTDISHDLTPHKFVNKDGAKVESTGRNPIVVTCKGLFYNNIYPGENETWTPGILYPQVYNIVIASCLDTSVGELQHPTLGKFKARLQSCKSALNAERRGGETLEFSFIETVEDEDTELLDIPYQFSAAHNADELDKDNYLQSVLAQIAEQPGNKDTVSFGDAARSIQARIDRATLFTRKVQAPIDNLIYRAQTLIDSLDSVANAAAAQPKVKAENLVYELRRLGRKAIAVTKNTSFYIVPNDSTTLSALTTRLNNNIEDLIHLNAKISTSPVLKKGTSVRYYVVQDL